MNVKHLSWLMLIVLLLLQVNGAEEQELGQQQDQEDTATTAALDMEMEISNHVIPTEAAKLKPMESLEEEGTAETVPEPEVQPEPETASGKAMEAMPTAATAATSATLPLESTHAPDYQDDEGAPHAATTPATTAAETSTTATTSAATTFAATTSAATTTMTVKLPPLPNDCFSCSSYKNGSCLRDPTMRIRCQLTARQRTGCYTLFKLDTKLITRGCVMDLSEEDDRYCRKETDLCRLCPGALCNRDVAATGAANPQLLTPVLTLWSVFLLAAARYVQN